MVPTVILLLSHPFLCLFESFCPDFHPTFHKDLDISCRSFYSNYKQICIFDSTIFSMTDGAQQALRRTMEIYSSTTRFALACNTSEKIIEPIQSRCAMLRYSKLTDAQVTLNSFHLAVKGEKEKMVHTYLFTHRKQAQYLLWHYWHNNPEGFYNLNKFITIMVAYYIYYLIFL